MQGLVCVPPSIDVVRAIRAEKLLTVDAGENVIRLLPPLIVSEAEIDEAGAAIGRAAYKLESAL